MSRGSSIGEFARRMGTSAKTVRYYEEIGLLQAPERSDAGYRRYVARDEERMRFVLGAKALGLSLGEIREILVNWAGGTRPCGQVSQLLARKLEDLDRRIAELVDFRGQLAAYITHVDAQGTPADVPCGHVQGVTDGQWTATPPELNDLKRQSGPGAP